MAVGGGCSRKPSTSDESRVHAAFEQYKQAARKSDGAAVAPLVTAQSVAHYERLRDLALTGTQAAIAELPYVKRIQIWMFRQLLTAENLRAMSGADVVAYVFDEHMMGRDLEETSAIDELQIEGTTATARHLARGRPAGGPIREVTLQWKKGEYGKWRLDLLHTLALMEVQLDDVHEMDPAKSKEELAQGIVQLFTRTELEPKHFEPIAPRTDVQGRIHGLHVRSVVADGVYARMGLVPTVTPRSETSRCTSWTSWSQTTQRRIQCT